MQYSDTYYATSHRRTPKNKIACSVATEDGKTVEGSVFVTGDQRVKDILNGENAFIPLETFDGEIYSLNCANIIRVVPHDNVAAPESNITRLDNN